MRILFPFVLAALLLSPVAMRAQSAQQAEALCHEIEKSIDTLTAYTHTCCSPSKGKLPGTYSLIVLSGGPVFSAEPSVKGWLLVAVGAVGYALNKNSAVKGGELWLSDPDNMKNHIAYTMSLQATKSLQRRVKSHQITLKEMYTEIEKDLTRKQIPRGEVSGPFNRYFAGRFTVEWAAISRTPVATGGQPAGGALSAETLDETETSSYKEVETLQWPPARPMTGKSCNRIPAWREGDTFIPIECRTGLRGRKEYPRGTYDGRATRDGGL